MSALAMQQHPQNNWSDQKSPKQERGVQGRRRVLGVSVLPKGCKLILEYPLGGILVKSQLDGHREGFSCFSSSPLRAGTAFCVSPALPSRIFLLPAPGCSWNFQFYAQALSLF